MLRTATAAALLTACLTGPVQAEGTGEWKDVGVWEVRVDQSLNHGCFMFGASGTTAIRVGFGHNATLHVFIGSRDWTSLRSGQKYRLTIRIDDNPVWEANATGAPLGETPALTFGIPADFLGEFMYGEAVRIKYGGKTVLHTKLNGTKAAGQEMLKCQQAMKDSGVRDAKDPFADSDDPFASSF